MMAGSALFGLITWFFPITLFLYVSVGLVVIHQIWILYCFLRWQFDRVEITEFGLRLTVGLIITHEYKLRMRGITDAGVTQSLLGQLLDYGTITVEQMGRKQPERRVDFLNHPYELFRELCDDEEEETLWKSLSAE